MNFNLFTQEISSRLQQSPTHMPAIDEPFSNVNRLEALTQNPTPRLGAVMMLIYNKNSIPYIILIERQEYKGVHSGQIALPGGAKDIRDDNLEITALRELKEEIGIGKNVYVIGKLSQVYIPVSTFLVTPYIGITSENPTFVKDDYEVKQIIEVPISHLFDDGIVKKGNIPIKQGGMRIDVPYFDIYNHRVWGATAIILNEFKILMK